MISVQKGCFLLLAACALAGCKQDKSEMVQGQWACSAVTKESTVKGDVEYVSNGKSNGQLELQMQQEGHAVVVALMAQGDWRTDEDQLVETVTKISPVAFSVDGRQLPTSEIPKGLIEGMEGASTQSKIVHLSSDTMVLEQGSETTTCKKK